MPDATYALDLDRGKYVVRDASGREIAAYDWETEARSAAEDASNVTKHETDYGTVEIGPDWVSVTADSDSLALERWATRPGHVWPCSDLRELDSITAGFDANGLVDLEQSPSFDEETGEGEVVAEEFNAWTSDAIGAVLPGDHPCWFITVGQFRERDDWPASAVAAWES